MDVEQPGEWPPKGVNEEFLKLNEQTNSTR